MNGSAISVPNQFGSLRERFSACNTDNSDTTLRRWLYPSVNRLSANLRRCDDTRSNRWATCVQTSCSRPSSRRTGSRIVSMQCGPCLITRQTKSQPSQSFVFQIRVTLLRCGLASLTSAWRGVGFVFFCDERRWWSQAGDGFHSVASTTQQEGRTGDAVSVLESKLSTLTTIRPPVAPMMRSNMRDNKWRANCSLRVSTLYG